MSCFWPINLIWPQQPQKWLPNCLIKSIFLQGLQYTVKLPAVNWTTYHSILEPFIQRSQYIKIHGCATNRDMLLLTTCFVGHQRWPNSFSLMRVLSQSNHADVTIWWFQHSIPYNAKQFIWALTPVGAFWMNDTDTLEWPHLKS